MQKPDPLVSQHRGDRALTVAPLRSNTESSLVATFSLLFKLTRAESRALVKLVKFDHVSKEELHQAIAHDDNPVTAIDNVKVVIYRLRQELGPYNIKFITVRGLGYRLDPTARDRIRKILAEYGEDVISAATPPVRQASEERT